MFRFHSLVNFPSLRTRGLANSSSRSLNQAASDMSSGAACWLDCWVLTGVFLSAGRKCFDLQRARCFNREPRLSEHVGLVGLLHIGGWVCF